MFAIIRTLFIATWLCVPSIQRVYGPLAKEVGAANR